MKRTRILHDSLKLDITEIHRISPISPGGTLSHPRPFPANHHDRWIQPRITGVRVPQISGWTWVWVQCLGQRTLHWPSQTEDDAMMQKIMLCLRCNSWMYQYQIYRSWRTHMVLDMCCISPFLLLAKFSTSPSSVVLYECLRHEELLIRSQGGHIPPWQPVCAAQATGGGLGNPCWLGQV